MLVAKPYVELLHSCGINILVVFTEIPEFCLDYKLYLPLKTFELATERQQTKGLNSRIMIVHVHYTIHVNLCKCLCHSLDNL